MAVTVCVSACNGNENKLSRYEIYASYDESAGTVTGSVKLDFYNDTDNELSDLKFNLYGNAFREGAKFKPVSDTYKTRAYYAGESYGKMEISGVENCAGWNVGGEDENTLTVNLLTPIYPEETVTVTINYTLTLAKVNHRTGITARTVNLGNFYPILCAYTSEGFLECPYYYCGDPFVSECANYSVTIDLPPDILRRAVESWFPRVKPTAEKSAHTRLKTQEILRSFYPRISRLLATTPTA